MSVVLGKSIKSGKEIEIGSIDRFNHLLIIGPNGCGKTSKVIKPCIWQDLIEIKTKRLNYEHKLKTLDIQTNLKIDSIRQSTHSQEEKLRRIEKVLDKKNRKLSEINPQDYIAGLTVIEPKGDLAEDVVKMCQLLGLPYYYINPLDEHTNKLNIMQGDADIVAESNRTVLRSLFGKQEAFFALIQETTARNTMLLLKRVLGDKIDIIDVGRSLRSADTLKIYVDKYEQLYGTDDLVEFFKSEVFGTLKDKFYQFALGLRQQLEDISNNKYLQRVLIGESDVRLDDHLEKGTILIVNTAMGPLGKLGDTFGQFVIMHLQNAVFRRPGNEWTRAFHYLWIDEAPRYMNPDMERLLAIGRSYRCSVNLAIQSLGQLELEAKREFAGIVVTNCRNKVVFGGLSAQEAKEFEANFGAKEEKMKQFTYDYKRISPLPSLLPKSYRTTKQWKSRYDFTQIIELRSEPKKAEAIARCISNGAVLPPVKILTTIGAYKKPSSLLSLENKVAAIKSINLNKIMDNKPENYTKKEGDSQKESTDGNEVKKKVINIFLEMLMLLSQKTKQFLKNASKKQTAEYKDGYSTSKGGGYYFSPVDNNLGTSVSEAYTFDSGSPSLVAENPKPTSGIANKGDEGQGKIIDVTKIQLPAKNKSEAVESVSQKTSNEINNSAVESEKTDSNDVGSYNRVGSSGEKQEGVQAKAIEESSRPDQRAKDKKSLTKKTPNNPDLEEETSDISFPAQNSNTEIKPVSHDKPKYDDYWG